ncbi:MAG: BLUF domain-containing protein [Marivita sp.]|uniref:BLUF domain-containing protein n=1 Tax=Marivita sp. TaxID=2003365 RepID=UPI003EF0B97C
MSHHVSPFGAVFTGVTDIPAIQQIVYSSRPFGFDDAMLNGVLVDARRCNARDGVSGALICRQDVYLQLLEGPDGMLQNTFARIQRDDRHLEVTMRASGFVRSRMFGDWTMFHDPAKSRIWSAAEVADGALDRASSEDYIKIFEQLAEDANLSDRGA